LNEYLIGLPKAELHLHIEGTLEPELAFRLAKKHGVALPYATVEELRQAYQFADLQSFLDIYYAGANVLRDESDFYELTRAYLQKAHSQGIVHAEIFFDAQAHTGRGVPFSTVIGGILRASQEAERELRITYRLILSFLRDLSAADAMRTTSTVASACVGTVEMDAASCVRRSIPPRIVLTAQTGGVYMVAARATKLADADQAFVVRDLEEDKWWLLVAWDPSASASLCSCSTFCVRRLQGRSRHRAALQDS